MSLLKTNEIQNYNGSSLTLTASTVSTSAQLNTGGNISVTGSLNVSDDSTTRTNLGLGTISTQDSNNVNLTGGTISSAVVFPAGVVIGMAFLADVRNGHSGSSSTSATLRVLNTAIFNINCPTTIVSNEFSFDEAGTYVIYASAPAYSAVGHLLRLSDDGGSTFIGVGTSEINYNVSSVQTRSFLCKDVTIATSQITGGASQKDFGFWHIVNNAYSSNGLGVSNDDTTVEQHLQVQIFRLA